MHVLFQPNHWEDRITLLWNRKPNTDPEIGAHTNEKRQRRGKKRRARTHTPNQRWSLFETAHIFKCTH